MAMIEYSVVIQAGGQSSRMGADKGLSSFKGKPLTQFILDQAASLNRDMFLVSNSPALYREFGCPVFIDVLPNVGALGGFHTILHYLNNPYALVLACDMPFLNLALIDYMAQNAAGFDVVVPRLPGSGYLEPFRGFYSKGCLHAIDVAIRKGRRKAISFYDHVSVRYIDPTEIEQFDPDYASFININTPAELENAQRRQVGQE